MACLQAAQHDQFSLNAFVSIPFSEREFIPKVYEPSYFVDDGNPPPLPNREEWHRDAGYGADLVNALVKQDYKNIRVEQVGNVLSLSLTNSRISNLGRAVGRAAHGRRFHTEGCHDPAYYIYQAGQADCHLRIFRSAKAERLFGWQD